MFEPDSDDGIEFKRVLKKIRKTYPDAINKYEVQPKKRNDFIVPDNEDSGEEESESGSYNDEDQSPESPKKAKKEQKSDKKERKVEKKPVEKKPVEKRKV
jgi:hypothetical protein